MTVRPAAFGTVFGSVSERVRGDLLQPAMAVVLALGVLTAIFTDGSVPALVTKGLLTAMVIPTVATAFWLTRPSDGRRSLDGTD